MTTFVVDRKGRAILAKDPDAILDYIFDWTSWLNDVGDTIADAIVTADATSGLVVGTVSVIDGGTKVVAWVSGGTVGKLGRLTCEITTANSPSRVDDRSVYLRLVER